MRFATKTAKWGRLWVAPLCAALALTVPELSLQRVARHAEAAVGQHRADFTQPELDQMLAPVALYPDSLLSQILMAATYPLEVVEAARWSRANAHLHGRDAVAAVEPMNWDPSVKSLVAFPRILAMMSDRLQWTRDLGDAFLEQEPHVMQTIQDLRRRAVAAGTLRSSGEVRVEQRDRLVFIEPADAEVAYVPYYDPVVAYGTWWWPAYPPVRWAPWPGYVAAGPRYAFYWGPAISVGAVFFFGAFDWHRRHTKVIHRHEHNVYVDRTIVQRVNRGPLPVGSRWTHDPDHRRGVDYRSERVRHRVVQEQRAWRAERDGSVPARSPDGRRTQDVAPGAALQSPPARASAVNPSERDARPLPPSRSDEPARRERPARLRDRAATDDGPVSPAPAPEAERLPRNATANEPRDRADRGQRKGENRNRNAERPAAAPSAAPSGASAAPSQVERPARNSATIESPDRERRPSLNRGRDAERAPAAASPAPPNRSADDGARHANRSRAVEDHPGRGASQRRERSADTPRRESRVREQPAVSAGAHPRIDHGPRLSLPQPRAVAPAPASPRPRAQEGGVPSAESRGQSSGRPAQARERAKGQGPARAERRERGNS